MSRTQNAGEKRIRLIHNRICVYKCFAFQKFEKKNAEKNFKLKFWSLNPRNCKELKNRKN